MRRPSSASHGSKNYLSTSLDDSAKCLQVLTDLAEQGLLRAYALRCGGKPCAMGIGYQKDGVYHYYETAYCEEFAKLSPGRVLLYLMLEDLLKGSDRPTSILVRLGRHGVQGLVRQHIARRRQRLVVAQDAAKPGAVFGACGSRETWPPGARNSCPHQA